jgi:hypothetical protein
MPTEVKPTLEAESFAIPEAIAATLQAYLDGARAGMGATLRCVFAESARICGTYDGKPIDWSLQEFCEIIEKNGPAADLDARIVAIEYAGNAAMARVEACNWRGTRYTDFFVLSLLDNTWKISGKVFYAHSRS